MDTEENDKQTFFFFLRHCLTKRFCASLSPRRVLGALRGHKSVHTVTLRDPPLKYWSPQGEPFEICCFF